MHAPDHVVIGMTQIPGEVTMAFRKFAVILLAGCIPMTAVTTSSAQTPAATAVASTPRSKTVEDLAAKLVDRFVDPETGLRYAAMLRANNAAGKYDAIASDEDFAKQVTADLQAVAFDGHLKVFVQPKDQQGGLPPGSAAAKSKTVEATARLPIAIAYVRFGNFLGTDEGMAAVRKFIADNQDARTIIFDMRTHNGGGLDEMDVIFPYLFDKETALVDMDTRSAVERAGDFQLPPTPQLRKLASPDTVVRREHFVTPLKSSPLSKAKVFVLTSGHTASAGEHFVLALRRTHRAIVIGETTYGAGNFGGNIPLEGNFSVFIPVGRTFDPDTGKGWDYVGVAPDVAVPQEQALAEALLRSGLPKSEADKLAEQYRPSAEAFTRKRKAPTSVAGI